MQKTRHSLRINDDLGYKLASAIRKINNDTHINR